MMVVVVLVEGRYWAYFVGGWSVLSPIAAGIEPTHEPDIHGPELHVTIYLTPVGLICHLQCKWQRRQLSPFYYDSLPPAIIS